MNKFKIVFGLITILPLVGITACNGDQIKSLAEYASGLENEINSLNDEVDSLNSYTSKLNDEITKLNSEIDNLNITISSLEKDLKEADDSNKQEYERKILELNEEISKLTARIAELEEKEYNTVSFDTKGGTNVSPVKVEHGEKIDIPEDPVKPGHTFKGWTYQNEPWLFNFYVVTEDITLEANWDVIDYTVIFTNDDGTILEKQENIHYGDSVVYHGKNPEKSNPEDHYVYTFDGWGSDLTSIKGNTVAIAHYLKEYTPYMAIFLDEEGHQLLSSFVQEGDTPVFKGVEPSREFDEELQLHYQFSGWEEFDRTENTVIYKPVFESCTEGLIFENNSVYQYIGNSKKVVVPSRWNDNEINTISSRAFYDTSVEEINLPSGIVSIEQAAFAECRKLKTINLPETLTFTQGATFNYCESLEYIKIPGNLSLVPSFLNCTSLKTVDIMEGVSSIGASCFYGCTSLKTINLPESLNSIGAEAFYNCYSLEYLSLPKNMTIIKENTFRNCGSLVSVDIPLSVTTIEYEAFRGCWGLKNVFISKNVENVQWHIFEEDSAVILMEREYRPKEWSTEWSYGTGNIVWGYQKNLELDGYTFALSEISGIKHALLLDFDSTIVDFNMPILDGYIIDGMRNGIFKENDNLITVHIPADFDYFPPVNSKLLKYYFVDENNQTYFSNNGIVYKKNDLSYVMFPNAYEGAVIIPEGSETIIGTKGKTGITSVFIPEGITYINGSFDGCVSLKYVVIPKSVFLISADSFKGCTSLEAVFYAGENKEEWDTIVINRTDLNSAKLLDETPLYFYSELKPSDEGNYWHYVDGVPTIWE